MEKTVTLAEGHFRGFKIVQGLKVPEVYHFPDNEFEIRVPGDARIYKRKEGGVIRYYIDKPTNVSMDTHIFDLYAGDAEHPSVLKYVGYIPRFPVRIDP
jgi:hypothetical protein